METDSLDKKAVAGLLQDAPEPLRTVLTLRQQLARSSVKKYQAMENAVCQDSRAAGDPAVRHTCNDAPVIQVNNAAIVARFPVFQEQIREIRTPLVIRMVCMKLPLQLVFKDFMRFSAPIARFLRADERIQPHFRIHVFMYGNRTIMTAPARQIDRHGPVPCNSVMRMVNFPNQRFSCVFLGIIVRLPVFPVVVISIRADAEPPQQPADAEFSAMLFNQSISL